MMKKLLFAAASAALLVLGGCIGDGDTTTDDGTDPPANTLTFSFTQVFSALSFNLPVAMLQAPRDDSRWFVVQQDGVIQKFDNDEAVAAADVGEFLDISDRVSSVNDGDETGLLGMAFHPDFPADPRVFVYYTRTVNGQLVSQVSQFDTADDDTLDATSEVVLLSVAQPESNHKGGNLAFGTDGMLYIGLGDGGGSGDQHGSFGNGQNTQTLLGKILRIDVGEPGDDAYSIPSGNTFSGNARCDTGAGTDDCPEIYAFGFRNPWRFSFDRTTGDLWVGDVGQDNWEEVDNVVSGGNYGWRCREGSHDFNATDCGSANSDDLLDPVIEYDHTAGESVIGGYVYRGSAIPALVGRYVFGDLNGRLWNISTTTAVTTEIDSTDAADSQLEIHSLAQDIDGELYIVAGDGNLYRIDAS